MRSPFRRRQRGRRIRFGEKGVVALCYLGDLPFETRGEYTGHLYAWNKNYPMRHVDKRDLPGLEKEVGKDDFEEYPRPAQPPPKPAPKSKSKPKPKPIEVQTPPKKKKSYSDDKPRQKSFKSRPSNSKKFRSSPAPSRKSRTRSPSVRKSSSGKRRR